MSSYIQISLQRCIAFPEEDPLLYGSIPPATNPMLFVRISSVAPVSALLPFAKDFLEWRRDLLANGHDDTNFEEALEVCLCL